jgi:transketolase
LDLKTQKSVDQLSINTIRTLSMDAVQAANSGHPGTPMALAPVVYCLWQRLLRYDPEDPIWPNRDRFVLSVGHASMLLYSMVHLTGVKSVDPDYEVLGEPSVTLEDIKNFRQLDSKCPGHPEYRWTAGVETTTGPLGQGVATSVGMAIAGEWMASYFNRPGFEMFDYDVYTLCGDGDLMEGISGEAASLAGHLELSNLCWIYDNNRITIEGNTSMAFSEDVATRFIGWNVTRVGDANDLEMLERAFQVFKNTYDRPTLIVMDSHIAYGAPSKQDTSGAHGEPLGEDEIRETKRVYGWPEDAKFLVPEEVVTNFRDDMGKRGHDLREVWMAKLEDYRRQYPELAVRPGIGRREGRLRPGRRGRRGAGGPVAGDRQRGAPVPRRLRAAHGRRDKSPRGKHAFVGDLRATEQGVPRERHPRRRHRARFGGAGFHAWLEEVCRIGRADHRHEDLRGFGAAEGAAREVRLYPPGCGERGDGAARQGREERMRR